jgi:hypothetical protein
MERYEKYKDSGVEWIGEIPEVWVVKKIRRLSIVQRGPHQDQFLILNTLMIKVNGHGFASLMYQQVSDIWKI